MMIYDFDKDTDRRHSDAYKYVVLEQEWGRADLIPMWVADMEFETPQFITEALKKRMEHSVFGYTKDPKDYWPSVIDWIQSHHQWTVKREWLSYIPGIVKGLAFAINVFTEPGDKVIIQPPVYHPFRNTTVGNGRVAVENPLIEREDGYYDMDFDNLAEVCDEKCKLLILCNPHNPAGLVWSKDTLQRLAHFCAEHHLIVVSDEIHCDMTLYGHKHTPFASVSKEAEQCSITFSAPSKTFNIAGIVSSWAIVPNDALREKFFGWLDANELSETNMFAPIATVAALRGGEEWRQQMIRYVEGNIDMVVDFCKENTPDIKALRPQASYLIWLDCRKLVKRLGNRSLRDFFTNGARLALNDGDMFGKQGEGFMRMNVACNKQMIEQALKQLKEAYDNV